MLRACSWLRENGREVSVLCPSGTPLEEACRRQNIQVIAFDDLNNASIDILYCTVMGRICEAKVLAGLVSKNTAIILKTGLPPIEGLSAEYYGANGGAAIRRLHVVSQSVKTAFIEAYPEMEKNFIQVFFEGVDPKFSAIVKKRTKQNNLRVACVSRLEAIKGQSVLLRAIPIILRRNPRTRFLFAGEGSQTELLKEMAVDLGIDHAVNFLGNVEDIDAFLDTVDILCQPSLLEGLPNSVIEAMYKEVPVVASDLPGICEVIRSGFNGLLVRPNDVQALAAALVRLIENPFERKVFGKQAQLSVAEKFCFDANMRILLGGLQKESANLALPCEAPVIHQPEKLINLLFVMSEIRLGGEETEVALLARHIDKNRYRISVVQCHISSEFSSIPQQLLTYGIRVDDAPSYMPTHNGKINYLIQKIKREAIDIVVSFQDPRLVVEAARHCIAFGCRLIEHGGILADVDQAGKEFTLRYIGVSKDITARAAQRMHQSEHAVFIPSMVDIDLYDHCNWAEARGLSKQWLMKTFSLNEDRCVVIFAGRLDPRKHAEDLVESARIVRSDCPEAFFLIIGGIDSHNQTYGENLISGAQDLVDTGYLAFTGARDDIAGLLSAGNILVLPSTGEGMAHVINEAGAAGLAVIASDDGAARDQLEDGKLGIIFRPRAIDELADALRTLIKNKNLRTTLGSKLKAKVRQTYSARVVVGQWHSVFEEVLKLN